MLLKSSIPTTDARPHSWYFVHPKVCMGMCAIVIESISLFSLTIWASC